ECSRSPRVHKERGLPNHIMAGDFKLGPLGTIAAVILVVGIIGILLLGIGNLMGIGGDALPSLKGAAAQVESAGWGFIVLSAALAVIVIVIAILRSRDT